MTKLSARVAGAFLSGLLFAGCATVQYQAFREPEVTVDAAALASGLQSLSFDLDMHIFNPNHYRLDASRIRYRLLVDSIDLASGMIERRVTLRPRDTVTVRAPVEVDGLAVPPLVIRFLFSNGSLPFQLVGDMRIETTFGSVTREFDQRGTYELGTGRVTIFKRK
jgi:LEA14-like dessication related protein